MNSIFTAETRPALVEAVRRRHFEEVLTVLCAATDLDKTRQQRIEALVDGMIAVHSTYPAAYRVLLEESPRSEDARGAHDFFEIECRKGYEAIVRTNARRSTDTRFAAQVFARAIAGAVHEAARQGTLGSPILREEIITLARSYLSACRTSVAASVR